MSLPSNFDIRYSNLEDLNYLQMWFSEPRVCDPYPFGFDEREEALKNWIGFAKYNASLTGTLDGVPCAIGTLFLMPYRKVGHHCSFYLIVEESKRRQGIGFSMVRNLLHLAKTRFRLDSVHVEIFDPNPLLSLLRRLQFEPFAHQEKYVKMEGCYLSRTLLEHYFR